MLTNDSVVPETFRGTGHLCTCCGRFVLEEGGMCVRAGAHSLQEGPSAPSQC